MYSTVNAHTTKWKQARDRINEVYLLLHQIWSYFESLVYRTYRPNQIHTHRERDHHLFNYVVNSSGPIRWYILAQFDTIVKWNECEKYHLTRVQFMCRTTVFTLHRYVQWHFHVHVFKELSPFKCRQSETMLTTSNLYTTLVNFPLPIFQTFSSLYWTLTHTHTAHTAHTHSATGVLVSVFVLGGI